MSGEQRGPLPHQGVERLEPLVLCRCCHQGGVLLVLVLTLPFLHSALIAALPGLNPPPRSPVFAGQSVQSFSLSLGPPVCSAVSPSVSYSIASPLSLLRSDHCSLAGRTLNPSSTFLRKAAPRPEWLPFAGSGDLML